MSILADPRNDIPTSTSPDSAWMSWLDECVSALGKKAGTQVWLKFWVNRATASQNTSALREYVKKQGISITSDNIFGSLEDTGKDVVGGITSTIGGFLNMGKIGVYAVGGVILVSVVILVIGIAKHPKDFATMIPKP